MARITGANFDPEDGDHIVLTIHSLNPKRTPFTVRLTLADAKNVSEDLSHCLEMARQYQVHEERCERARERAGRLIDASD